MRILNMAMFDKRRRMALALLALLLALIVGPLVSIPVAQASSQASTSTSATPLLPGEPLWGGTPAYLYGVNDSVNWDPAYNMDVAPDGPVIQAQIKTAAVPIARTWFFQNSLVDGHAMSDAEQLQKLHAVQAAGMVCFANFPH